MIKKLKSLKRNKILSLCMCFMLVMNFGVSNYFAQEVKAAVIEDPQKVLSIADIPEKALLDKLTALADVKVNGIGDGKLTIEELNDYKGDANGKLDLSQQDFTNIKGLAYAKGVKSIDLSNNSRLNTIPDNAFFNCTNLQSIVLPDGIISLGISAFNGCTSLSSINLPNGLTNIGNECFSACTSLINITLPEKIQNLGTGAFSSSGLYSIKIPNSAVVIGANCFQGCKSLRIVDLPEGTKSISEGCFAGTGIFTISMPTTIETIGSSAFVYSDLCSIDLSMCTNLVSIQMSAFSCTPLSDIVLPESLKVLGSRAFENCKFLTEIKIPSQIDFIDELTFSECIILQNVIFSPTIVNGENSYALQEIGQRAFVGCSNLGGSGRNVGFLKNLNNLSTIGDEAFANCSSEIEGVRDEYGQQSYYGIQSVEFPGNLTKLGIGMFSDCKTLKSVTIPNKVGVIENNSFKNCINLQTVILSDTLTTIGESSFAECRSLQNIDFPASLTSIGRNAFLREEKTQSPYIVMDKLILPDNLTKIGTGAFKGCFNIKEVELPVNLTELGNNIFDECSGLKSVKFPTNLLSIGEATFRNCSNLNLVEGKLPSKLNVLGANSFENCKALTSVVIPYNIKEISSSTFAECSELKIINYEFAGMLEKIGASAFKNTGINLKMWLPETVKTIEYGAFQGCKELPAVNFSNKLIQIGNSSFADCIKMSDITIPASATFVHTGSSASFYGCYSLIGIASTASPDTIGTKENAHIQVPIDTFTETDTVGGVQIADESIVTKTLTYIEGKPQIILNGVKAGETTITINGTIEHQVSAKTDGTPLVLRPHSTVTYKVKVTADKCTGVIFNETRKAISIDNLDGITLKPSISPEETTDLKHWSSGNVNVVTVSDTGVVKPVGYGSTKIKLIVGDKQAECTVYVTAPASWISLDKTDETLIIGNTVAITPTLTYSSIYIGTNNHDVVIWSSSNPNTATVDESGNVKGIAAGEATITARADAGNKIFQCKVSVIPETTNVSFGIQSKMTLIQGNANENSKTITMTVDPADSPLSKIKVESSNTDAATVSVTGNILTVTAQGGGTTTITATPVRGKAAVCIVSVEAPLTFINASSMELNKDSTRTIDLEIRPRITTEKIVYSSNNPAIATVDANGLVKGIAGGTAIITIKSEKNALMSTTCVVTVKVPVSGIAFTSLNTTVIKNSQLQLGKIAIIQPSDATNKTIIWSSNNPSVASVDTNGVVTGVGYGTAKIIATTAEGSFMEFCTVTVTLPMLGGKSFDINNDGKIDILDFSLVSNSYNSTPISSLYNVKYDLTSDNIIDIYDIVLVRKYMS